MTRRWAKRTAFGLLIGVLSVPVPMAPAGAAAIEEPCSRGDALAVWNSFATFLRLEDAYPPCQYRLFWDGEHATFHDSDWFVGGNAQFFFASDLEQFGLTREEGIAELEKWTGRFWLAKIGPRGKVGTLVEQSLMLTPFRDEKGIVFRQVGVILNVPPGDYLSVFEEVCESEILEFFGCEMGKVYRYEVTLHVLPD